MRSLRQMKSRSKNGRKRIGVFDSGFGGLTILKGIVQELPKYDYVYLGDTARTPYGTRSPEVVYEFTKQAVDFLFTHGSELILFACNTASSDALRKIQREYIPKRYPGKKVLGVLIPAAEEAVRVTKRGRIGVIATEGTVLSDAFPRELSKLDSRIRVFQKACPLLVPLIEAGEHRTPAARLILKNYLRPLLLKHIDTLILGCTHYGIIERDIRKITGKNVRIISEGSVVPRKLKKYLAGHSDVEQKLSRGGHIAFYSTAATNKFERLGSVFFGKKIHVKRAALL